MGISVATFYNWQKNYKEFLEAIKKGKAPVDLEVENALLKRALGYEYEETVTDIIELPDGKTRKHVRRFKKHMPADVGAMAFWLKNRRTDRWRDKPQSMIEGTDDALNEVLKRWNDASAGK